MRPSASRSMITKSNLRSWKETWAASVTDGSAWAKANMHNARRGQSGQLLSFWPSGQHGISPVMAAMSLIGGSCLAALDVTSGATTRPTVTNTASSQRMNR